MPEEESCIVAERHSRFLSDDRPSLSVGPRGRLVAGGPVRRAGGDGGGPEDHGTDIRGSVLVPEYVKHGRRKDTLCLELSRGDVGLHEQPGRISIDKEQALGTAQATVAIGAFVVAVGEGEAVPFPGQQSDPIANRAKQDGRGTARIP